MLWLASLVIAATAVAIYLPTLDAPFVFDDRPAIEQNSSIREWWKLGSVLTPPATGSGVTGRPLVNLSLALNYAISGLDVRGFRATNIAIHALSALVLFGLVGRTMQRSGIPLVLQRHALSCAFAVALLWTAHPLLSETIICVIQRTESLVSLFLLLTLYCWVRATDAAHPRRWLALAVVACAAGMAAKEVMVVAPVLVLLYDRAFLAGTFAEVWRRRGRWLLALGATWLLLSVVLISHTGQRGVAAGFGLGLSPWQYLLTQCEAITLYLKLSFWPNPLVADYGMPVVRRAADVVPEGLAILALVAATIVALVRTPRLGFIGAWFLGILAPSSSFVPLITQTVAEHRMYLPLAAVITLVVTMLFRLSARVALGVAVVLTVAAAAMTVRRGQDYASELRLWEKTVTQFPGNPRAHFNLAFALYNAGRIDDAVQHFERAVAIVPVFVEARIELGRIALDRAQPADAARHLEQALRIAPDSALARSKMGAALIQLGRPQDAIRELERAAHLDPNDADTAANWGVALLQLNQPAAAVTQLERALSLNPDLPGGHYALGQALVQADRVHEAVPQLQEAVRRAPDDGEAQLFLGVTLLQARRPGEALSPLEAAVLLMPDSAVAQVNLGAAMEQTGRTAEARRRYQEALRLDPQFDAARQMLDRLPANP